jgi:hypothetical protein
VVRAERVERSMMDFGDRRIRTKVVALLVVLVALWAYAAFVTGRDALDLLQVRTLGETLGQPADLLILDLQAERRGTVTALGDPASPRTTLTEQRGRTDAAIAALRAFGRDTDLRLTSADAVRDRANALVRRLDGIGSLRQDVDAGRLDRNRAVGAYGELIDAGFAVYGSQWASRESDLIDTTRAMVALARAREMLAREDALVAGALAAGRTTAAEQRRIVEVIAAARFARAEASAGLPAPEQTGYQRLTTGASFVTLLALEETLVGQNAAGGTVPVQARAWQTAVEPALAGLRDLVTGGIRDGVKRATPGAVWVIVRTGVVVGLGLIAVLAAIIGSVSTARGVAGRLGRLRATAEELSSQELPGIAHRLRRGEPVEAPAEPAAAPPGADQIAQLAVAIDAARASAIRAVLAEAEAHKGTWDLFLQLTRRNQVLLRDQLSLLDAMERRERDAEDLADLFRIDHLATRIRRNVEKLITMAGATPARRWRRPVSLLDVVRGAVAEVADYPRVLVAPNWTGALAGPVVPDVIHLLAELIENGLAFSSATSTVRIAGEPREGGCAIIVTDDGSGMSGPAVAEANELLRNPPRFRPPGTGQGLHAVGLIARRRGIQVGLKASPRGGTTATVLLPAGRLVGATGAGAGVPGQRPQRPAGYSGRPAGTTTTGQPDPSTTVRDTPAGLPVRARQSGPNGPRSERVSAPRSPDQVASAAGERTPGQYAGEGGPRSRPAATGPREADGSETMEIPIARSAHDSPEPNRPDNRPPTIGTGPSTHPTRTGGGFNGSERTTSGSANGQDR